MSTTKTIGNGAYPDHEPIGLEFFHSFVVPKELFENTGYKASGGAERATRVGEIQYHPAIPKESSGTATIPDDDDLIMRYCYDSGERNCYVLAKPTLAHYMFTGIFCNLKKIVLRDGTVIKRSYKGRNIAYFETKRFLFIEQNKDKNSKSGERTRLGSKLMWIIRKEDGSYIGRVENGELIKTL